jgi:hypothetical protein
MMDVAPTLCLGGIRILLVLLAVVAPVHAQQGANAPTLTKTFMPDVAAPDSTVTLQLTITDNNGDNPNATLYNFAFSDDLGAALSGLTATSALSNTCSGIGSGFPTSNFTYSGGTLASGASCTMELQLAVPAGASPGTYTNTTSDITGTVDTCDDGCDVPVTGSPASDDLVVPPPPMFGKSFAPNPVTTGQVSVLSFTIDNSASALAASSLDFADNLPAGLVVATPANDSTTCTGGTLTATDGSSSIGYTGGTVTAGATCTVSVDVTAATEGSYVNISGSLTSSLGDSGSATDTLVVNLGIVPTLGGIGLMLLSILLTVLAYWHLRRPGHA